MIKSLITVLAIVSSTAALANVQGHHDPTPMRKSVHFDEANAVLTLRGPTTKDMSAKVHSIMVKHEVLVVNMAGPGGHYYAGLNIGNLIAKEGSAVIVPKGLECVSACAFAAMATKEKLVINGALLFHLPYTQGVSTVKTIQEVQQEAGLVYFDMVAYVARHGYPVYFARELLAQTSPCKFVYVKDAESFLATRTGDVTKPKSYKRKVTNRCMPSFQR
jgi:hypothetical protein